MSFDGFPPPLALDQAAVERGFARLRRQLQAAAERRPDTVPDPAPDDALAAIEPLLAGIFAGSPFLAECLQSEPDIARRFAGEGPDRPADALLAEVDALETHDRQRLMTALRRARRKVALLAALADLGGAWELDQVTAFLSRFAELAVDKATHLLLAEAAARGDLPRTDGPPLAAMGVFVLGMGKLGAGELNYSSDIDLIVLFDEDRLPYRGAEAPMALAVRLARGLTYILEQPTRDGYVFRTDLRLRPHLPGHPLAISTDAAELYYERHGQNWERAAFIKARTVGGDRAAGATFLERLRPYVWRRSLDYAAIRDIHSIKRQINAHRGFSRIRLRGHDLKVGRGGIREIEFFAQVQQLILGGRDPGLRAPDTCTALRALAGERWIDPAAADELIGAYRFLRALEHRLQMVADRQTQVLPTAPDEFARFAAFCGSRSPKELGTAILATLQTVERHYAALFESEPDLGLGGSLVFTGTEDDPATIATLRQLGFSEPEAVSQRIRGWHHGHIRATRSTRARELLTELLPGILSALRRQNRIDDAFRLFDDFIAGLPAGVQIFSLFRANPRLVELLADLIGAAPRLAPHLARNVDLFEALLQPDFFEALPSRDMLLAELRARLGDARDLEDVLDGCRRWAHGRQFQAGLQVLLGVADFRRAAAMLTELAETVLATLVPVAETWLERQHGRIAGGRFCVVGLGKFGARELTIGSDLDLIFLYEAPLEARSQGSRPLDAATWYARLGHRLVSAISAQTAEGRLFEIDMRLRPSGNVGPVAASLAAFGAYQERTAETWERQSLCRARPVAGDPGLQRRTAAAIEDAIRRPRDPQVLAADICRMRGRIFKEHGSADPWNLKHARGGLIEIEFIAQFLQLAHACRLRELRTPGTADALRRAAAHGLVTQGEADELVTALELQQALQMILRLGMSDRFVPETAPAGLKEALMRAASRLTPDLPPVTEWSALERRLVESQGRARSFFEALCGATADEAGEQA